MIKVYIPTHNRAETCTTHKHFTDPKLWEFRYVVHDEKQMEMYLEAKPELEGKIFVGNTPYGLLNNRKKIDDMVSDDEWYMSGDDDIEEITAVDPKLWNVSYLEEKNLTKEVFNHEVSEQRLYDICTDMFNRCDKKGYKLWGINSIDNPYFRGTKIRESVFIIGWLWGSKKDSSIPYLYDKITIKDDYMRTAISILYSGGTLRNDFLSGKAQMFQSGGIGLSSKDRRGDYIDNSNSLIEMFPGLFENNFARTDPSAEIKIVLRHTAISRWRLQMIIKGKLDKDYAYKILDKDKADEFIKRLN